MENKIKIGVVLTTTILLCSCGIFRDKNLAKRYKNNSSLSTFDNSPNPQLFVQVDLNSILINEAKEKEVKYNMLSLSDKGQEAFINSANSKSTTSQELIDLLSTNFSFSKSEKTKTKVIPKTIKKTLIFTVDRLQYHYTPAKDGEKALTTFNNIGDRISYLELSVKISSDDKAIFNSWDKYVTDKVVLNLGKVSSAQNWNASLNVSAKGNVETSLSGSNTAEDFSSNKESNTILVKTDNDNTSTNNYELVSTDKESGSKTNSLKANGEIGGNATIGYSDKYETSLDLSSQILKLSGTLAENKILLRQEGGPGIDLSGNIVVSIEYTLTDDWALPVQYFKISNLYTSNGLPTPLNKLNVSFLTVIFPDIQKNITGELDYSFLYRQVNKGNKHLPEARQRVKFRYGSVSYNQNNLIGNSLIDLVKTQDVRPKVYVIRIKENINNLSLNNEELKFETISDAVAFLAYIKDLKLASEVFTNLTIKTDPLLVDDIAKLQIVTVQL